MSFLCEIRYPPPYQVENTHKHTQIVFSDYYLWRFVAVAAFTEDINQTIPKTVIGSKISSSSCWLRHCYFYSSLAIDFDFELIHNGQSTGHLLRQSFVGRFFCRKSMAHPLCMLKDSPVLDAVYKPLNRYNIGFNLMYSLWNENETKRKGERKRRRWRRNEPATVSFTARFNLQR